MNAENGGLSEPLVLIPFDRREALSVAQAARIADRSISTVSNWCGRFHIGRRLAGGNLAVSRVALQLLLEGKLHDLEAYLSGDRSSSGVVSCYRQLGLADIVKQWAVDNPSQNSQSF